MSSDIDTINLVDEAVRRRFESHWRQGKPRPIEEFLPAAGESRYLPTLEELVHIDIEFAWKSRTSAPPPRLETYLARFPELQQPPILLRLIGQEYQVRRQYGDSPTHEEYRARFPNAIVTGNELLPTHAWVKDAPPPKPLAAAPWQPGVRVGRYELAVEYARGGVGVVWRARDPSLGREIALKQLNSRSASQAATCARFVAEARVAAQLEHPGVVPVYDVGGLEDATPYYAMKLVRGRTLTDAIRHFHEQTKQTAEAGVEQLRLLNAFLAVTRALAYAHSRGVIHRDLKPDNILLGDYGETVILDWGMAKIKAGGPADSPAAGQPAPVSADVEATHAGAIMGTPAYMSPEQAAGRANEVDERSDIYSLGAILYQVLTGCRAFPGSTFEEVLDQVLHQQPPPPRALNGKVPRPLEAICRRALAKSPERRYPSVAELTRDLERFLADEPVSAYRENAGQRLARWVRHHRTSSAVAAVAALLLLATGTGIWIWTDRLEQDRRREVAERQVRIRSVREKDAALARAEVQAGRFESAEKILSEAVDRLRGQAGLDDVRGDLDQQRQRAAGIGRFYRLVDDTWSLSFQELDQQAIATCEQSLQTIGAWEPRDWWAHFPDKELTGPQRTQLRQDVYQMFHLLAGLRVKQGLMKFGTPTAADAYRAALAIVDRVQPVQPSESLRLIEIFCHTMLGQRDRIPARKPVGAMHATDEFFLGMLHFWLHAFPDNVLTRALLETVAEHSTALAKDNRLQRAQELLRSAITRDPTQHVYYIWQGIVLLVDKDFHGAELAFGSAVALRPNDRWTHNFRATALRFWAFDTEDAAERRALCQRGLRYVDRALELDPNEPTNHWLRADLLAALERPAETLQSVVRYFDVQQPPAALNDWRDTRGFFGLVAAESVEKQYVTSYLDYAANIRQTDPSNLDARTAVAQGNLLLDNLDAALAAADPLPDQPILPRLRAVRGTVMLRRNQLDRAVADFDLVLQAMPSNYLAAVGTALVLEKQGKHAPALAAFDRVVQVAATDWQRFEGHMGRARALVALGRKEEARQAVDRARGINIVLANAKAARLLRE